MNSKILGLALACVALVLMISAVTQVFNLRIAITVVLGVVAFYACVVGAVYFLSR